jgi:endonuclease-3
MSKVARVVTALDEHYGRQVWRGGRNVLDELIYTILSQNTTAKNCNEAFRRLSERFRTWDEARLARWEDIAEPIRVGGLANRKAPRIKRLIEQLHERRGSLELGWIATASEAEAIDFLMGFDGVGRKTATCVLMFGLGRPVMPVDTHVHRVSTRLGLIGKMSPEMAHDALQAIVPREDAYSLHINMVTHGRLVCRARGLECSRCCISGDCDYYAEQSETNR